MVINMAFYLRVEMIISNLHLRKLKLGVGVGAGDEVIV